MGCGADGAHCALRERIRELEARLAKDSHNSSRPPSSDSPFKKPPPRSQRQPSGRKPGGQPGRRGVTRSLVDHPDQCGIISLTGTCACGRCGTGIAATVLAERRQVVEVVIQREVIEYRIVSGTCACGRAQRSTFPAGIEAPVQYGPGGSAFAVYMTPYPLRPYQCTAEVLNERAGLTISPGTLQRTVRVAATRLEAPVTAIRRALVAAPVAHANETGRRVNGNLYRLHVLSTNRLTACFPHPKRGAEAPDAFGLLSQFVGVLGHHHWSAYERYQCLHAFCKAHHLRQLIAIAERSPSQPWATDMIALLCQANALVGEAQNLKALPTGNVERLRTRYNTILTEPAGGSNNPRPATSFGGYASTATRSCASSPTCAFPATTTRPNATFVCPSSSRKSPIVPASKPAERPLPSSAPAFQPAANSPTVFSTRSS